MMPDALMLGVLARVGHVHRVRVRVLIVPSRAGVNAYILIWWSLRWTTPALVGR